MQRLDGSEEEKYVKACIYGPPGTGKTTMGVTAPKPLILLSERQGIVHIKQAVRRLKCPMPYVLYCETTEDVANAMRGLRGDRSKPFCVKEKNEDGTFNVLIEGEWPESTVIDSTTEFAAMFANELDAQYQPKVGKDGLPARAMNWWGVFDTKFTNFVKAFRDLPMHVFFLCLSDDKTSGEGEDQTRSIGPSLPMRKLSEKLSAAVNVVGFTFRRARRERAADGSIVTALKYGVLTVGPEHMLTKPYRPLRDAEVPDLSYWIQVIQGTWDAPTPEAPPTISELDSGMPPTTNPEPSETLAEPVEPQDATKSPTGAYTQEMTEEFSEAQQTSIQKPATRTTKKVTK